MQDKKPKRPPKLALDMLKALKDNPAGLDIVQLRHLVLKPNDTQQHLDRRLRSLDPFYIITREREGQRTVYKYIKTRTEGEWEFEDIPKTLRAEILNKAAGRCQMCGRTINEDNIKLHIDHKIPRSWGGKTQSDNLWAICSICNEGKKNYFANFDTEIMAAIMVHKSVHKRIAELLHMNQGEWVERDLIEFVANAIDQQEDWQKRLRELRYFKLQIDSRRTRIGKRTVSQYRLKNWVILPEDPTKAAREYERKRAQRNRRETL
jgi:hypothetical protein